MSKDLHDEKVSVKKKVTYGSIEFANSLSLIALLTFGLYFLTDVAHVNAGIAGTILAVGTVVSAISAPVIGYLSDNCKAKMGRRRPFLLATAVPFGLTLWLFFSDFGLTGGAKIVYYVVIIIVYYIAMSALDVPYTSLGAEITKDYDERTSLNTYRSVFCQLASIIGGSVVISIAAAIAMGLGTGDAVGWSVTGAIMGLLCVLIILNGWRGTKGFERHKESNERMSIKAFAKAFKNRPFVYVLCLYSAGIGAYTVGQCVQMYFLAAYMQMSETEITMVLIVYNVAAICWLPLIPFISKKFSKVAAWVVMMGLWIFATLLIFFFVRPGDTILIYIFTAIAGAGSMVAYTVGWSMLPDCIEVEEYKEGDRHEGVYYGILSIIQKGFSAVVTMVMGFVLVAINYDETASLQSAFTTSAIRYIYVFGAILFVVLSYIFAAKYPLSRKKHAMLREAIEAKKKGEEYDTSGIQDLIR